MTARLHVLLPVGSLNNPKRSLTLEVFRRAGLELEGYEPGQEYRPVLVNDDASEFSDNDIRFSLSRPWDAPDLLRGGAADIAITGNICVWEYEQSRWSTRTVHVRGTHAENDVIKPTPCTEHLGNLEYGTIDIVTATLQGTKGNSLEEFFTSKRKALCFTEYVNIAKWYFYMHPCYPKLVKAFPEFPPMLFDLGTSLGGNPNFEIHRTHGLTESILGMAPEGSLTVEAVKTGSTMKSYCLKRLGTIERSTTGIYARRGLEKEKHALATSLFTRLERAAREHVLATPLAR
jgi:ATP phosphoribosyltransferase